MRKASGRNSPCVEYVDDLDVGCRHGNDDDGTDVYDDAAFGDDCGSGSVVCGGDTGLAAPAGPSLVAWLPRVLDAVRSERVCATATDAGAAEEGRLLRENPHASASALAGAAGRGALFPTAPNSYFSVVCSANPLHEVLHLRLEK